AAQQFEAEAVLHVEGFGFVAEVGVVQAAIRHHAVYVKGHQPDRLGPLAQFVRHHSFVCSYITPARSRSCMFSAPAGVPSGPVTIRAVMRFLSIRLSASTASTWGCTVLGFLVITLLMGVFCRSIA